MFIIPVVVLLVSPLRWFDPMMLTISATPYQSTMTVVYQRLTVIITDIMLFYAINKFVQARSTLYKSYSESQRQITLVRTTKK